MSEPTNNTFFLWAAYSNAGSFLEEIDNIPQEELSSNENYQLCNDALTRLTEIKTRILVAQSQSEPKKLQETVKNM